MSYFAHHVFFCTNERDDGRPSCGECGNGLRDYAKKKVKALELSGQGRVRINSAGCLDRCDEGPTLVIYPEGVWYHCATEADVDEIIRSHLQGGVAVERLRM